MKMRLDDHVVVDLADEPEKRYHPDLAKLFVQVPDDAPTDLEIGDRYEGGNWLKPIVPPQEESPVSDDGLSRRMLVSVARFKAQFSLETQIKVQIARAYVPIDPAAPDIGKLTVKAGLDALYDSLTDLKDEGSQVDIADPKVQGALDWMASVGLMSQDEADEIKAGVES